MKFTHAELYAKLQAHGHPGDRDHGESLTVKINEHVSVHDHPHSGRPRELHFMVDGVKVAELGPQDPPSDHFPEDVEPGYLSIMAQWAGQYVDHADYKFQLLVDNGLVAVLHPAGTAAPYEVS